MENVEDVLEVSALDDAERAAAAAALDAAIEMIRPGLRTLCRRQDAKSHDELDELASGGGIILGGVGETHHPKGPYASTGHVSGWEFVLLPDGRIMRRTYAGAHSDFSAYHRVTYRNAPASAADVVSWSTSGADADLAAALQALQRRCDRVGSARNVAIARERAEKIARALRELTGEPQ